MSHVSWVEAGKTVDDVNADETFPDPTDRASMESNRDSVLQIRDRELIFKIEEALTRLDNYVSWSKVGCSFAFVLAWKKIPLYADLAIWKRNEPYQRRPARSGDLRSPP
jgi:hypothetical protein